MTRVSSQFNGKKDKDWLILCDVGGTLVDARIDEPVNQTLLWFLIAYKKEGFNITLFAREPEKVQDIVTDICRRYCGDADIFGKVQSKSAFEKAEAFMVIDDDHASHKVKTDFIMDPVRNERSFWKMTNFVVNTIGEIDRAAAKPRPPEA